MVKTLFDVGVNQDSKKKPTPSNDPLSEQWIDLRLIVGMRVVLGTSALLVLLIGPLRTLPGYMPIYFTLVSTHAFCRDARVEISCKETSLLLQIKNSRPRTGANADGEPRDGNEGVKAFRPHSIAERAASLGGDTQVFVDDKDYTVVSVGIPL